jgi:antitoxin component HigA of HigAB toxin-antitoxin module
MKTKKIALMFCVVLLCGGTLLCAKSDSTEGRPRIGIVLDIKPLPDLLIKHLKLEPGQGIRISNIQEDSPADKAGLQRDDIIIGFEGEQIKSNKQLIDAVQQAGVGAEVSLEIIHLGERKTVKLQLEVVSGETGLKYPSEPEIFQSWRPGKMFRLKPGEKDWMEMELPFDEKSLEIHEYHYSDDEEGYSVTIEGDPEDEDALITIHIGDDSYQTAVGKIDNLPEKYRQVARKALENSRKHSQQRIKNKTRKFYDKLKSDELELARKTLDAVNKHLKGNRVVIRSNPDPNDLLRQLEEQISLGQIDLPESGQDKKMFDKIEEQTRKLQQRVEELEKRFKEIPKRSPEKPEKEQI